jgi:hypothetical protein
MAAARRDGQDGTMLFALLLLLTTGCIAFILVREGQPGPRPAGVLFAILDLAPSDDDNRRVLAVLAYLDS